MTNDFGFEGVSLTVKDVEHSLRFYRDQLKLEVAYVSLPAFALLRIDAGSIGLLSEEQAFKDGVSPSSAEQKRGVHIEFSTDDLDGLYTTLLKNGVLFAQPPHDEPWERSMTAYDPDGHSVEFAQGKRGSTLSPKKD